MKKLAIVGTGARARVLGKPLVNEFNDEVMLIGVYDRNPARAAVFANECGGVQVYSDFDSLLTSGAEAVLVTTMDCTHDEYIIRSLEAGLEVISEKPMTTDVDQCKAILDAEQRTGREIKVAFNCRYMPYMMRLKELLKAGTIGDVLSVDYNWYLDSSHGAQYFRRWHRRMENSGGLLVHKSTHHFDLANWWLDDEPEEVHAMGSLRFFGPHRENRGDRCLTCHHQATCEFYYDIKKSAFDKQYYYDCESEDGYIRDKCVFGSDIDIYDTMSVHVRYRRGAILNYSLAAHSPYKNWTATFNGTLGRIEAGEFYTGKRANETFQQIRIYNRRGDEITYESMKASGSHGGSDDRIRNMLFRNEGDDLLGQRAGSRAGAMSLLIGVAANLSIAEQRNVRIDDMLE